MYFTLSGLTVVQLSFTLADTVIGRSIDNFISCLMKVNPYRLTRTCPFASQSDYVSIDAVKVRYAMIGSLGGLLR